MVRRVSSSSSFCPCRLGLLRTPLGRLHASLRVGEHRVYEVHVGSHRLLGDGLRGLRLALVLLGQPLGRLPILLGLGTQTVDGLVEEDLGSWALSSRAEAPRSTAT